MRSKYLTDEDVSLEISQRRIWPDGPSLNFPKDPDPITEPRPCEGWKMSFWYAVNRSEHRVTP